MMDFIQVRREIAGRYLKGKGIEVGALHAPLEVPAGVTVSYVDRLPVAELRKQYPELATANLVEADIVDDGENLASIPDSSWDFVIANHMIEHCQDPIGTLENFLRVIKPGGVLYMGVPDKRYTFDIDRPLTSLDHLIRDHTEGAGWSRRSHFEEWVRLVDKTLEQDVAARIQYLLDINYSIHFHVWTFETFSELLKYCQTIFLRNFEIELFQENFGEVIVILRKSVNESSLM